MTLAPRAPVLTWGSPPRGLLRSLDGLGSSPLPLSAATAMQ